MNDWNDIATALEKLAEKMGGETVKDARLNDIKRIHAAINNISEKYAPCESGSGGGSGSGGNVVTIPIEFKYLQGQYYLVPQISPSEFIALISATDENGVLNLYTADDSEGVNIYTVVNRYLYEGEARIGVTDIKDNVTNYGIATDGEKWYLSYYGTTFDGSDIITVFQSTAYDPNTSEGDGMM